MPYKDIDKRREAGREAARRYRERHPERVVESVMRSRDPVKHLARAHVAYAKRTGKITPGVCDVCGSANTEAHHINYTRPLDVQWLCRIHHAEAHAA